MKYNSSQEYAFLILYMISRRHIHFMQLFLDCSWVKNKQSLKGPNIPHREFFHNIEF